MKVGGYTEKNWFSGGSVPVFFPTFSIPQIGVRVKPVKEVVARLNVGFSITGFFFGISGSYGIPQKKEGETASPAPWPLPGLTQVTAAGRDCLFGRRTN